MHGLGRFTQAMVIALGTAALAAPATAGGLSFVLQGKGGTPGGNGGTSPGGGGGGGGGACPSGSLCNADGTVTDAYVLSNGGRAVQSYGWMSPDVSAAWGSGYCGQGTTMVFVDDFSSSDKFGPGDYYAYTGVHNATGGFTGTESGVSKQHGYWTTEEAGMVAPMAAVVADDFSNEDPIYLAPGFNAVNLSYGMMGSPLAYSSHWYNRGYAQEKSIIQGAAAGNAVYVKAAGNDHVAVGTPTTSGTLDYLGKSLIGTATTIFVGALDSNGTTSSKAKLSWYSDYAGTDTSVQNNFVVVGVDYSTTGLAGTSFAAPIVTGYAAIIESKFTGATPQQVHDQIVNTARTDTLVNYTKAVYGMGEASLSRALSPASIQ